MDRGYDRGPADAKTGGGNSGPRSGLEQGAATLEDVRVGRAIVREQVERVITAIRPAIQADEGDIALIDVDEETGLVTVELMGACVTCPASTQTLKAGIERILMDRVEGVTEVVEINAIGMSESPVSL